MGSRFGLLEVIEQADTRRFPSGQTALCWLCRCVNCGDTRVVQGNHLRSGHAASCRCAASKHPTVSGVTVCSCHGLPTLRKGSKNRCRVKYTESQRRANQQSNVRKVKAKARAALLDPEDKNKLRRQRKDVSDRYAAARALGCAVRGVSLSTAPIDRGPEQPPLCACHHEPMLSHGRTQDGTTEYMCGVTRRELERARYAKHQRENYEKARAKQSRSERRRRARKRGALSEPYTRAEILERDGGRCRYCDEKVGAVWHVAHLVALARGGDDTLDNVAVSCAACNIADGVGRLPVQLHLPRAA